MKKLFTLRKLTSYSWNRKIIEIKSKVDHVEIFSEPVNCTLTAEKKTVLVRTKPNIFEFARPVSTVFKDSQFFGVSENDRV